MIDRSHMWQVLANDTMLSCYQPRPIVKVDVWGEVLQDWRSMGECCDSTGMSIKMLRTRIKKSEKYLTQYGYTFYYRSIWEAQGQKHCISGQLFL